MTTLRHFRSRPLLAYVIALLLAPRVFPIPAAAAGPPVAVRCPQTASGDLGGVPRQRIERLSRGFNLTGWLDQTLPRRPSKALLTQLRAMGFSHVRLPVKAEALMPRFAGPGAIGVTMTELDAALAALNDAGFAVSLDVHPGGDFAKRHRENAELGLADLVALWTTLATRYRGRDPDSLFFELLNEPTIDAATWRAQAEALVKKIRAIAPNHTIVYGTSDFQRHDVLAASKPLSQLNIVYAVHYYDPFVFTHQGLTWAPTDPARHLSGVPFPGILRDAALTSQISKLETRAETAAAAAALAEAYRTPWTAERVGKDMSVLKVWMATHGRPIVVNEFGVLSFAAKPPDRARWLKAVVGAAESGCIGWTHWEFADGFGFLQLDGARATIDFDILEALLGGKRR